MTKTHWDESLIIYLELVQFFTVNDEGRKMAFGQEGQIEPKTYTLPKTAQKNDFDEIYERELKETGLEENSKSIVNWRGRLIKDIQYKIDRYILLIPRKNQHIDLIEKAEYFIQFLSEMDKHQKKEHQGQGNLFPLVFKDEFGYRLFERLHENNKDSNTTLADYSFIYRMMWEEDRLLLNHQKPEVFRKWLSEEPFNIVLGLKFKRLVDCSPKGKKAEYYSTKELVRTQMNEQNNS
jgi:hypothetical protein